MDKTNYSWDLMTSNLFLQTNRRKNSLSNYSTNLTYGKSTSDKIQVSSDDNILIWFITNLVVFTIVLISGLVYIDKIDFNHLVKKDYEILVFLGTVSVVNFIFFIISGYKLIVKDMCGLNKKSYNNYGTDNIRRNNINTFLRLGDRIYMNGRLVV
jgi:amino acid transporter